MRVLGIKEVESVSGGALQGRGRRARGEVVGVVTGLSFSVRSGNLATVMGTSPFGSAAGAAPVMVKYALR